MKKTPKEYNIPIKKLEKKIEQVYTKLWNNFQEWLFLNAVDLERGICFKGEKECLTDKSCSDSRIFIESIRHLLNEIIIGYCEKEHEYEIYPDVVEFVKNIRDQMNEFIEEQKGKRRLGVC